MIALLADFQRHLVRHTGGGRVAARRVFEQVGVVEFHFAREQKGLFKIIFRLAGKPTMMSVVIPMSGRSRRNFLTRPRKRSRV